MNVDEDDFIINVLKTVVDECLQHMIPYMDLRGRLSSQQIAQSMTDCLTVFHQYIMSLVLVVGE